MTASRIPDFRPNPWQSPKVSINAQADGSLIVDAGRPSNSAYVNVIAMFQHAVSRFGHRHFMAQRNKDCGEWQYLTYAEADRLSDHLAQWLLAQPGSCSGPVMILSHNSLEHAVMNLAAMKARRPVAPVSPNYSLLSRDFAKLRAIYQLLKPSLLFVQDTHVYGNALDSLVDQVNETPTTNPDENLTKTPIANSGENLNKTPTQILYVSGPARLGATSYHQALDTQITPAVSESIQNIRGEDVAKILFTSGSTGEPKGVLNTHENLTFTQAALTTVIQVDEENNPPVLLDWMPWHHTYGGNQNVHRVMNSGGTLYIDDGRPLPGEFDKTLRNLKSVPINSYTTVPAVYALLLDAMEKDHELRRHFFEHLDWCSYGGSDMPQQTFDRFQTMAMEETGQRIAMINALGSTESAAIITIVHWATEKMGSVGLPIPGTKLKLVPEGDKFELCVKGPQMTPGYLHADNLTRKAYDQDGFFHTGDAVRWVDNHDPRKGLLFAGRVSEDFKLSNGTWVHTGMLRVNLLSSLAPLVSDLVITGQDKDYLGAMLWLNEGVVRKVFSATDVAIEDLLSHPRLLARLTDCLHHHNRENSGMSTRIQRVLILVEPPSMDAGEVSDKRYINQAKVLARRADRVDALYADEPGPEVIRCWPVPA